MSHRLPRDVDGAALARVGTLASILTDVAQHLEIERSELLETLFG